MLFVPFLIGTLFERVGQNCERIVFNLIIRMKGIVSFVCTFQHQAYHLLCRSRYALVANTDKGYALTITNVVIWCINVRRPEGKSIIQFRIPCQLVNSSTSKKTFFYFITLTPSQSAWHALFIGVSVVRVSGEGKLSPLTLVLTPQSVWNPLVLSRHNQKKDPS